MSRHNRFLVGIVFTAMLSGNLAAQSIYGTLTGIVSDPSQAVVAGAALKLRDQQSGSLRDSRHQHRRLFHLLVGAAGHVPAHRSRQGIRDSQADRHRSRRRRQDELNVTLKVGNTSNVVEVSGNRGRGRPRRFRRELQPPHHQGARQLHPARQQRRGVHQDHAGLRHHQRHVNTANYNGQTIGINGNGNGGNQSPLNGAYSYNGLPANSLDITADGAHVSDPGCNCATPVNPNSKMISEFKVTMSNFSAENQKGPGVISSVAKGGGNTFHGSAFISARNAVLNANDWLSNYSAAWRGRRISITTPASRSAARSCCPSPTSIASATSSSSSPAISISTRCSTPACCAPPFPRRRARRRLLARRTRQARQHHGLRLGAPASSTPRRLACIPAASSRRPRSTRTCRR